MKIQSRVVLTGLALILLGFVVGLQTKAAIGVSLVNSTFISISTITGLKFGTVSNIVNSFFYFITDFNIKKRS